MRKTTAATMFIILGALVTMMVAADMALKPVRRDLAVARDLTAELEVRGDIEKGSKVVTVARRAEKRHLAESGWGMVLEMQPSERVRTHKGRLELLAYRAVRSAGALYARSRGRPLEWYEIHMLVGAQQVARTLIPVGAGGRLGRAKPPLPAVLAPASHP